MKCHYMCANGGRRRVWKSPQRENDPSICFYSFHLSLPVALFVIVALPYVVVDAGNLARPVSWSVEGVQSCKWRWTYL